MASVDAFDDGFIRPSLIHDMQRILDQYPDDGQIIKELIQNAEDAGAKEIRFLLDETSYESNDPQQFCGPELNTFQGPALYAYNDAVFSEDDWTGLRTVFDSIKKKDPMKVGRFGLGFKSVFHMTDLPSVLSGKALGYLDPQERYLQVERSTGQRRRLQHTSTRRLQLKTYKQQFQNDWEQQLQPYLQPTFGCNKDSFEKCYYNGTMFRFPLRNAEMDSELCSTLYNPEKVLTLFQTLQADGHVVLLFLKSLERIQLLHKRHKNSEPEVLYEIKVSESCLDQLRCERKQLIQHITSKLSFTNVYPIEIETSAHDQIVLRRRFLVCQHFISEGPDAENPSLGLGNLPWVGVAASLDTSPVPGPEGHVFCFLPLPLEETSPTGLHCHVNGYFAVDQNRRHIKWPSADQNIEDITDEALLWNIHLVQHLLPTGLAELIKFFSKFEELKNKVRWECVQKFIPNPEFVTPKWKSVVEPVYSLLRHSPILYSEVNGGSWLSLDEALFFPEEIVQEDVFNTLHEVLIAGNQPVVKINAHIAKAFEQLFRVKCCKVEPSLVQSTLKRVQNKILLTPGKRLDLLKYFIQHGESQNLEELELIKRKDGKFVALSRHDTNSIYIDSQQHPQSLLPGLDHMFLEKECLDQSSLQALERVARQGTYQLNFLAPGHIPHMVKLLEQTFTSSQEDTVICEDRNLGLYWLEKLWTYINREGIPLTDLCHVHLLPIGSNQRVKLQTDRPILVSHGKNATLDFQMKSIMQGFGSVVLERLPSFIENNSHIWEYVNPPTLEGILHVMDKAVKRHGDKYVRSRFADLASEQKRHFRCIVTKSHLQKSTASFGVLKLLPMFETLSSNNATCFVSASEVSVATDPVHVKGRLPEKCICVEKQTDAELLQALGVAILNKAELFHKLIFPAIRTQRFFTPLEVDTVMKTVLVNHQQFVKELQSLPFLHNKTGKYFAPNSLFDPTDTRLQVVFEGEDVFPVGELANPSYNHCLISLGLKTVKSVSAADLLGIAVRIDKRKTYHCRNIGETFLSVLCEQQNLLNKTVDHQQLHIHLEKLRWVPVMTKRPQMYPSELPFIGEMCDMICAYPSEVSSARHMLSCAAVRPIADLPTHCKQLKAIFGFDKTPPLKCLLQQLKKMQTLDTKEITHHIASVVHEVYQILQNQSPKDVAYALEQLNFDQWVWNGEGFASQKDVVLNAHGLKLAPYVFQIPKDFQKYNQLFLSQGVMEIPDLPYVLHRIKDQYENNPLSKYWKRDLFMVVNLLNTMANDDAECNMEVLVPIKTDEGLVLKPRGDCTHCDAEWHKQGFAMEDTEDSEEALNIVHGMIPPDTVSWLKIPSLVSRILDAEDLDVGIGYGQSEPLTRRLNTLLKDYSDGLTVFKELIQNADDAGADEVCFVFDERDNNDSRVFLFDEGLKEFQGPAIWAYNNAVFTADDFENIVKLSGATKETKKKKVPTATLR